MSIEELERDGSIRRLPANPRRIEEALALAARDLSVAESVLAVNPD